MSEVDPNPVMVRRRGPRVARNVAPVPHGRAGRGDHTPAVAGPAPAGQR